jgi:hypothetical protein
MLSVVGSPLENEDGMDNEDGQQREQVAVHVQQHVDIGWFISQLEFSIDIDDPSFRSAGRDVRSTATRMGLMSGIARGSVFWFAGGRCKL